MGMSGLGVVILCIWAETHPVALYLGTALLGVGMASIFATGFLWVERHMTVTARIGSAFTVASSAGADVFPLLVGQLVEDHPAGFLHLTASVWAGCVIVFGLACLAGRAGQRAAQAEGGVDNTALKHE
jgi:hypothetical protein